MPFPLGVAVCTFAKYNTFLCQTKHFLQFFFGVYINPCLGKKCPESVVSDENARILLPKTVKTQISCCVLRLEASAMSRMRWRIPNPPIQYHWVRCPVMGRTPYSSAGGTYESPWRWVSAHRPYSNIPASDHRSPWDSTLAGVGTPLDCHCGKNDHSSRWLVHRSCCRRVVPEPEKGFPTVSQQRTRHHSSWRTCPGRDTHVTREFHKTSHLEVVWISKSSTGSYPPFWQIFWMFIFVGKIHCCLPVWTSHFWICVLANIMICGQLLFFASS